MKGKKKKYLSSHEAAEIMGVAVSTIQLWTNNGLLEAWTTGGGHRRIACSSVYEMLEQRRGAPANENKEQQLSVVVVEDNAQQLRLYEKQFHNLDMSIHMVIAKDGYEGLIKIGGTIPDVVITDLMMPNMDGIQMVRVLKEQPELKHSLIVVITGLDENEVNVMGGVPKGVELLTKPIPFEELESLLRQKLRAKAA